MRLAGYTAPRDLAEAIALLGSNPLARPLAGGNSLLVEPNRSCIGDAELVDLRCIAELSGIQAWDRGLWIGAMTTLVRIADDTAIRKQYPALAEAARSIGDAQVRNRATIGGNLAERDPGADLPAVLLALDAQIEIHGPDGTRTIAAGESGTRPAPTWLAQGEIITAITLPALTGRSGSAYEKVAHPATLYAICGVAASVTLAADGSLSTCQMAVSGAAASPVRLQAVEDALVGHPLDTTAIPTALEQDVKSLRFRDDHFASAEYRRHLTGVLAQRAIRRAVERASASSRDRA